MKSQPRLPASPACLVELASPRGSAGVAALTFALTGCVDSEAAIGSGIMLALGLMAVTFWLWRRIKGPRFKIKYALPRMAATARMDVDLEAMTARIRAGADRARVLPIERRSNGHWVMFADGKWQPVNPPLTVELERQYKARTCHA